MKKLFIIAALLVAGIATSFAVEYTAKAKISMNNTILTLRESQSYIQGFNNGACMNTFNDYAIVAYVEGIADHENLWSQWGVKDLEGLQLAFKVAAAGEQTLTFASVEGTTLYLVDAVANKKTEIANGGSYVFTAEAADVANWNTTRFSITKVAPLPDYYFDGKVLTLGEKKEETTATAQGFGYVSGKRVNNEASASTTGNTLLLSAYEDQTTYFEVTYTTKSDEVRKFIVNIKPNVVEVPAND